MLRPKSGRIPLFLLSVALFGTVSACTLNTSKKEYVLAEKLWSDGKYAASVSEFDKLYARDPRGRLGHQALYRAAMTQAYFLSQYGDAVRKFRNYAQISGDKKMTVEALRQVGEILYSKTNQYAQAIHHYQMMLQKYPDSPEAPLYLYRVGKSHFYLWQFSDAVKTYRKLISTYPSSPWAEKAAYEVGVTYFTQGEQKPDANHGSTDDNLTYHEAIDSFNQFLQKYPKSKWTPLAKFGIASCLEEMDQLDAAYKAYAEIKKTYPSPAVIEIKLARIRERKAQRNR